MRRLLAPFVIIAALATLGGATAAPASAAGANCTVSFPGYPQWDSAFVAYTFLIRADCNGSTQNIKFDRDASSGLSTGLYDQGRHVHHQTVYPTNDLIGTNLNEGIPVYFNIGYGEVEVRNWGNSCGAGGQNSTVRREIAFAVKPFGFGSQYGPWHPAQSDTTSIC